ncbi:MAG: amidohydrolase family protein [Ginsengibacter sp.]
MRIIKFPFCLFLFAIFSMSISLNVSAQATFPVNGIANPQNNVYAFTKATIVKDADNIIENATLLIQGKKIVAIGKNVSIPKDAIIIDCQGKYIYPSFIDMYGDYGIPSPQRPGSGGFNPFAAPQLTSETKGPVGWNQALKPESNSVELFTASDKDATSLRESGFGTVLTHRRDGIARGTGTLVTLATQPDNFVVLKEKASAQYSFMRGTSTQSYPSSLMGVIALIRQTYLDADWYKNAPEEEGKNLSLSAWNNIQSLPQIFEANDKWASIRANNIGKEFGIKYIIKAGGNEYQRLNEIADMKTAFIVPLNFPAGIDVDDPNDARHVALADMKHWEMAPANPAAFEKAKIKFTLTTDGLKDSRTFWTNIRKAIHEGLSEKAALTALTKTPAELLNVTDMVGSLEAGKLANFIITTKPVFDDKAVILQNWIQGEKYGIKEDAWSPVAASYKLVMTAQNGTKTNYTLDVKSSNSATLIGKDSLATKFSFD